MDAVRLIKDQIGSNPVLLYMKGSPDEPRCGFSAHAVNALKACGAKFAFVDVLSNPDIRATLPKVSDWPTFPQLYINGELVGGSDIILALHESGALQNRLPAQE